MTHLIQQSHFIIDKHNHQVQKKSQYTPYGILNTRIHTPMDMTLNDQEFSSFPTQINAPNYS